MGKGFTLQWSEHESTRLQHSVAADHAKTEAQKQLFETNLKYNQTVHTNNVNPKPNAQLLLIWISRAFSDVCYRNVRVLINFDINAFRQANHVFFIVWILIISVFLKL